MDFICYHVNYAHEIFKEACYELKILSTDSAC